MVVRLDVSRAHDHTARVDYLRTGTHGLLAHAHVSDVTAGDGDVAREQFAGVHVRDGAAPHEEVGWPLATRRLQKPPAHFLAQAQTVSPRALAPLLRNVADDVTSQSPDPPLPDEVLEMGERLGERETELVVAEVLRGDPARDLKRGCRSPVKNRMHDRKPFFVVPQKLVYAAVEVVEERPVPREDDLHAQPSQPFQGLEVAF